MWTTIKLKQDCCIIVFKQLAVRNRWLLSLWQVFFPSQKYKIVIVEIFLARVREYLKLVRTSHLKQCQASQSTITFSTWSRPSSAASIHVYKPEMRAQEIHICKIQFDERCSLARKHAHDFMISDWFDRFDSTSSPLWDCDLGSSRMAADHYEGINLSAALQAQHLAARCDSKSAEPGWFLNDVFLLEGLIQGYHIGRNKLLILNM